MAESRKPGAGSVIWHDLTVAAAADLRDFYTAVEGWRPESVPMTGYSDYNMVVPASGEPAAGICHARGPNASLPPQWLMYVVVDNLQDALRRCLEKGGRIVDGPRGMGEQTFAVIRDPVGAHIALVEKPKV
jgi:predicted enzyme related to lactoylglutathione lyase